ncbi:restriction endonuclease [Dechloromonas denitrificans]|nr:restriction endonuclease [Dechloromonas denitrificans]
MARKKTSSFEDLMEIAALMPWWGGVLSALVVYMVLHHFAAQSNVLPTDLKGMGAFAGRELWRTFALFLQYLVPIAFLVGAFVSAVRAARARRLHGDVSRTPTRNALEAMSWNDFEALVGETFRLRGFQVEARGGSGPDGGVDLALRLGRDTYLVQCKQWKSRNVGVATVRELFGVMAAEGAVGGFVVASGAFTEDARRFAEGRAIELVGTDTLLALVRAGGAPAVGKPVAQPQASPVVAPVPVETAAADPVACPQCGSGMVVRTAKRGASAGEKFWGCSRYPACRGTRPA